MPSRGNAGLKLRLFGGHWEWADWQMKTLPDGAGIAMWVACEAPTLDGTPGGHYLAPDDTTSDKHGQRVLVRTQVYGWPSGHAAIAARERWEKQEREAGRG